MNPEEALINHIIKTGDIITPLNADVGKSFVLYAEEWEFISDYYTTYREVAPADVFYGKFPTFEQFQTDGSIDFYISELHKWKADHVLKGLITDAAGNLKDLGPYTVINRMQSELSKLGRDTKMVRDIDLVASSEERLENLRERILLRESGRDIVGIPTGYAAMDKAFGGYQKGDFVVILGWTGSFKSYFAMHSALSAWNQGYRVLYFSLEMSALQVGYRVDTMISGMTNGELRNEELLTAQGITYDRYKNWLGEVYRDKHPFVVVTNENLDEVNQDTVLAKIEHWQPDLVVLDYHHLFDDSSGAQGETEKAKNLSKAFKRIAVKTGTAIIDISLVTMQNGQGERPPELHEIGWSKQLAYDSDLTLSLCRYGQDLEVVSKKNRRGADFKFRLKFDIDSGRVKELSPDAFKRLQKDDDDEQDAEA